MFINTPDGSELRQGDIIRGLFYPQINCETLQLVGQPSADLMDSVADSEQQVGLSALVEKKHGLNVFTAQLKVSCAFFVVLSQCCDLAKRNGKPKIAAFVVSPLMDIPYTISNNMDALNELKLNQLESFTSFFYIKDHPPLLSKDYVVDFNQVVAFPRSEFNFVLSRKILQMNDKVRVNFKLKLSSHFGRPTEEENKNKLYPSP